jgi:hypothetical protein
VSVAQAPLVDNFGTFDYDDRGADDDDGRGSSILGGAIRLKFTNAARWETAPDGDDFTDRKLLAINVRRAEVYWDANAPSNAPPKYNRELAPDERFRDLKALNNAIPKSEWRESFGQLKGPWERQYILDFVNLDDMQRYCFPTSTIGGTRCVHEFDDRVKWMRRYRGENVYAVVALTRTFMTTNYGGRERPHLDIKSWIKIGGGETEAMSPPQAPTLPPEQEQATRPPQQEQVVLQEQAPPQQVASQAPAQTVKVQSVSEPTLAEELNDDIPWK